MRSVTTLNRVLASVLLAAGGCAAEPASDTPAAPLATDTVGSVNELGAALSGLEDGEESYESARAAAEECFDAFEACREAAGDDTVAEEACRAELDACLPERAPRGRDCDEDDVEEPADDDGTPAQDDTVPGDDDAALPADDGDDANPADDADDPDSATDDVPGTLSPYLRGADAGAGTDAVAQDAGAPADPAADDDVAPTDDAADDGMGRPDRGPSRDGDDAERGSGRGRGDRRGDDRRDDGDDTGVGGVAAGADAGADADADDGMRPGGEGRCSGGRGDHRDHRPRGRGGRRQCGDRSARDGAMQACRDEAEAVIAAGGTEEEAEAAHESCMQAAFEERRAELCAKATEKCADPASDVPADLCAEVAMHCDP